MRAFAAVLLASCAATPTPSPTPPKVPATITITPIEDEHEHEHEPAPAKPARVVALVRTTAVHADPYAASPRIGVVRAGTRAAVRDTVITNECTWIELEPRGWTCDVAVVATDDPPTTSADDASDDADAHPIRGVYGFVRSGAVAYATVADARESTNARALAGTNTVRAAGAVTIDGTRYWRTSRGELVPASSIVTLSPSEFAGTEIADAARMPAWVRGGKPAKLRAEPSPHAAIVGELAPRTLVAPIEVSADERFVRIADRDAWIARADLHVAAIAEPPPDVDVGAGEKWFDVDRDEQVLVAYEGARPVFATLVSTGRWQHETPTAIARIASKLESAEMSSDKESIYSVADVPWTMYYDRDFALHASYWHDGFGAPRSHGCVNLSPRDARRLYRWSSPDVPPGWIAVYADADAPGSLVRVRTRRDPAPTPRGYARTLRERRAAVATAS